MGFFLGGGWGGGAPWTETIEYELQIFVGTISEELQRNLELCTTCCQKINNF